MITKHHVRIPGSNVSAIVGERVPGVWTYTLASDDPDVGLIAEDEMSLQGVNVTPDQVGRIAFILECEYGS